MAQRDTTSTHKERKQIPSSIKLQTSLSHSESVQPKNQQESNSRRHLTLPVPLNNNYSSSSAEQYILSRVRMSSTSTEQQDSSPESPLSISSSFTGTNITEGPPLVCHAERMNKWYQKQANEIDKKHKHRYTYDRPVPAARTPTSLRADFFSPMHSRLSTQSNLSLSSQQNDTSSSASSTRKVKK